MPSQNFKWQVALPRIIADFLIIHLSMIAALAISVVYQTAVGDGVGAFEITSGFSRYYMAFFWLLSPIFPIVFWFNGFYTRSRAYSGRHKMLVILRGVFLSVLVFFAANFLLFGTHTVGRSVALPFCLLAGCGATGARMLKNEFVKYYDVRPKTDALPAPAGQKVLIVGGAGYIGSLLVRRLLDSGRKVRILDSLVYGHEPLQPVLNHPDLELIVGDCRNIRDMVAAVQGVEAIIDLAAIVGDPACEQDRKTALETNYAATRMMIEIAKGHRVGRFLFASSCSVYGATEVEVDERAAVEPISLYGRTKLESERALLEARSADFHPTILRFATVFGMSNRPRFDLVVNLLSAKARQEGVITIYNGQQWRPFIHVRDVVEAILRVLEAPAGLVGGEIFNVGDARLNYTLSGIAEKIRQVFPDTLVEHVDNADRRNYRVDFGKIRRRLGFQCRYSVEDGIREIKKAFDDSLITDYTDLHYHNQRFLQAAGSPGNKTELDAHVMAAFANSRFAGMTQPVEA